MDTESYQSPLGNSILPMVFEDEGEYKYWGLGSCFLFTYNRHQFLITALHVFDQGEMCRARVSLPGHRLCLNYESYKTFCSKDDDPLDLIVFKVNRNRLLQDFGEELHLIDITPYPCKFDFPESDCEFLVSGYPSDGRSYLDSTIVSELSTMTCRGMKRYTEEIIQTDIVEALFSDMDGMSGSPVFHVLMDSEGLAPPVFAGMLLLGSLGSGKAYFLDSRLIYCALDKYIEDDVRGESGG